MENIKELIETVKTQNILINDMLQDISKNINILDKAIKEAFKDDYICMPQLLTILEQTINFKSFYDGFSFDDEDGNKINIFGVRLVISDKLKFETNKNSISFRVLSKYLEALQKLNKYLKQQIISFN